MHSHSSVRSILPCHQNVLTMGPRIWTQPATRFSTNASAIFCASSRVAVVVTTWRYSSITPPRPLDTAKLGSRAPGSSSAAPDLIACRVAIPGMGSDTSLAQRVLLDLSGGSLGKLADEFDVAWHGEIRHALLAIVQQRLHRHLRPRLQHNTGLHLVLAASDLGLQRH